MSAAARAATGIFGAWVLAKRDPGGVAYFDDSPRGFWHSFSAALILLPAVLALGVLDGTIGGEAGIFRPLSVEMIAYVIQWTAFPVIMAQVSEAMGRGHRYIRYIVANNWASVIQMAVFLPVAVLAMVAPGGGVVVVGMMVTILLLIYQAYVAHVALEVPALPAAALVLLNVVLSGLIGSVAARMIGA